MSLKDWEKLKDELELTYEDPAMRTEWKNNLKAYVWDEHNVSLQTYSAKVKRYVDTFETDMADCPKALRGHGQMRSRSRKHCLKANDHKPQGAQKIGIHGNVSIWV